MIVQEPIQVGVGKHFPKLSRYLCTCNLITKIKLFFTCRLSFGIVLIIMNSTMLCSWRRDYTQKVRIITIFAVPSVARSKLSIFIKY